MEIEKIIKEMTVEEKASLCSGMDFWHTEAVKRLGVESIMMTDGPHGMRKVCDVNEDPEGKCGTVRAVCFPTASALACSYDRKLIKSLGEILGEECQAEDVAILLGPGINMKRSILCGRNFEYYSEDPYLAGELGANFVTGVQSQGVGTSLKHFAANNQETRRMTISANVDERTLREIYLSAFEKVVKQAHPWTIMCSYNSINGTYSCENDWLLNQVLRREWGFEGLVMSDWGAMNRRVKALKAGLDLEMPSSRGITDQEIVQAVEEGLLDKKTLDQACERVLELVDKCEENLQEKKSYGKEEHHERARQIEGECAVLLKNEALLPLKESQKVAMIGGYAKNPRYQGGGSSHVNSFKVTGALDSLNNNKEVTYALGFEVEQVKVDEKRIEDAVNVAKEAEVAVIFAGLPESFEYEGADRSHCSLPECQNRLIEEVVKVQPNTVVILHNGAPVILPWRNQVKAILEMYLGGQAVGQATVDLLYGKVNPSGKLAESFPLCLEDTPSYLNFPGTKKEVEYAEGLFIGYRYYDTKKMEVAFPFGHGLSYTTFSYTKMTATVTGNDRVSVMVSVKNTGEVYGKEVIQLYVEPIHPEVIRPKKELKGFEKVGLQPGEEKMIEIQLDRRAFAYYSIERQDWFVQGGSYRLLAASCSRDIRLEEVVSLKGDQQDEFAVTDHTLCKDVAEQVKDVDCLAMEIKRLAKSKGSEVTLDEVRSQLLGELPVHAVRSFLPVSISNEEMEEIVKKIKKS